MLQSNGKVCSNYSENDFGRVFHITAHWRVSKLGQWRDVPSTIYAGGEKVDSVARYIPANYSIETSLSGYTTIPLSVISKAITFF